MHLFTDLNTRIAALAALLPGEVSVQTLGAAVASLGDEQVVLLAEQTAQITHLLEQLSLASSAVIQARSAREAGHSGLAQSRGHRTPVALIQAVAGVSRGEAQRQVRVGSALLGAELSVAGVAGEQSLSTLDLADSLDPADSLAPPEPRARQIPWNEPLTEALRDGALSSQQYDAVVRGLGEPPAPRHDWRDEAERASSPQDETDPHSPSSTSPETVAAWALAAEQLIGFAAEVPVEELAKQARAVRDLLDPEGAELRFQARYEARSFRMYTDADGLTHGKFVFDPESAEWVRTIIDSALRPRRGGPRFVAAEAQAEAERLQRDPRSNEQLAHDLLLDVLKAGSVADAAAVFGVSQAGVRLVQVVNRDEYLREQAAVRSAASRGVALADPVVSWESVSSGVSGAPIAPVAPVTMLQESGTVVPESVGAKHRCDTGVRAVIVSELGDPLNVGREQRLYTAKQRVALAIRDGGCRWAGCDRPTSYCEAHHIDHWQTDSGRTDIDRGLLLCRFHHLQLHNNGWKITRDGLGPFKLHPPPQSSSSHPKEGRPSSPNSEVSELRPPLTLTYAWQLAKPPPLRFREAA